jgi:hypothetical protein
MTLLLVLNPDRYRGLFIDENSAHAERSLMVRHDPRRSGFRI